MHDLETIHRPETKKDQILYLKFNVSYWLQTLQDMLGWQNIYINGVIMVIT